MSEQDEAPAPAVPAPGETTVPSARDPLTRVRRIMRARSMWIGTGLLLAALAVVSGVFRHQLHWGDYPTWVLGLTTLLAFIAAGFGALVAYDVLEIERQRDKDAAAERGLARVDRARARYDRAQRIKAEVWAQAEQVTAWFSWVLEKPVLTGGVVQPRVAARGMRPDDTDSGQWSAVVKNASDEPVLDVRVHFYAVNDSRDGGPWTTDERYGAPERFRVIPPGQTRTLPLPYTKLGVEASEVSDQNWLVAIEFTDASGQQWYRNERAVLEPRGGRAAEAEQGVRLAAGFETWASLTQGLQ